MTHSTLRCGFVALLGVIPVLSRAQQPVRDTTIHSREIPNIERPAYENLRHREDWSIRFQGDPFDRLKRIDLPGDLWISLGGHARVRGEHVQNYLGGGSGVRDDDFAPIRAYAHADVHGPFGTRVFVEGRVARASGRDLPGGERTTDRDNLDWGNLFGEVTRRLNDGRATLRVGRQEMLFGRDRLVSPSDFSNVRRAFQGGVLELQLGTNAINGFYAHPVTVLQTEHNQPDHNRTFWGAYYARHRVSPGVFEFYVLENDVDTAAVGSKRTTISTRIIQPIIAGWQAEIEGGVQVGSIGDEKVHAGMIVTDFSRTWKVRWSPSLTFGADWSSGTHAGDSPETGTWDLLYPLGHSYLGYADVLGRRNVTELRIVGQASATSTLRLRLSGHVFRRSSADDGIYDLSGKVARASVPGAPRAIANEVDLTAQWRLQRHLRIDGGGAVFSPGGFMRATGAAEQYTWAFASLTAIF